MISEDLKVDIGDPSGAVTGVKRKCDEVDSSTESPLQSQCAGNNSESNGEPEKKLSRRQQKRLKKREAWLAWRPEKRAKERERLKCKRREARLNNLDLGPSRQQLKSKTMASSDCKINVAVDMSFDDYMQDLDISKCLKQLLHCYTLNRRADNPMQLFFTSFSGKSKAHMEKNAGYVNWDVNFKEEYISDIFPLDKIVYLSSDSPNIISTLEEEKVYVIGGLVDHNVHKGLCHKIAVEKGMYHARLPIDQFLKMSTRKVLTIDHVFEILLNVSSGLAWEDAFLKVLPKRKGAIAINKDNNGETAKNNLTSSSFERETFKIEVKEGHTDMCGQEKHKTEVKEEHTGICGKEKHKTEVKEEHTDMCGVEKHKTEVKEENTDMCGVEEQTQLKTGEKNIFVSGNQAGSEVKAQIDESKQTESKQR